MPFHNLLALFLLCVLQAEESHEGRLGAINVDRISPNVSETSNGVRVSWSKPDDAVYPQCYESNMRFRRTCDTEWQSLTSLKFFYDFKLDRKKNYEFQIRMKYDKRCSLGRHVEWTTWTPTISWGNSTEKGPCVKMEGEELSNTRLHVLIALGLFACFLVTCTLSHKRVKRWLLPSIPDPQHILDNNLDMGQPQSHVYTEPCADCEVVYIEIVHGQWLQDEEEMQVPLHLDDKKRAEQMNAEAHGIRSFAQDVILCDTDLRCYPCLDTSQPYIMNNSLDLVLKAG